MQAMRCVYLHPLPLSIAAIAASGSLTRVNLRRNNLGDAGVSALIGGGALSSNLLAIDFAETDLGPEGAAVIAQALEAGCSLRSLDVSFNFIDQPAALALLSAMGGKDMVSVGMAGCELGPDGVKALASLASSTDSLTCINALRNAAETNPGHSPNKPNLPYPTLLSLFR